MYNLACVLEAATLHPTSRAGTERSRGADVMVAGSGDERTRETPERTSWKRSPAGDVIACAAAPAGVLECIFINF